MLSSQKSEGSDTSSSSSIELEEDDEGNVYEVPKHGSLNDDNEVFKRRIIAEMKEQYKENNMKSIDVKLLLIKDDVEEILRVIEKYPLLLDKFTTQALISGLLNYDLNIYEILLTEEGVPDLTKVIKCAILWNSEPMLDWCRHNMTEGLDEDQQKYISVYLNDLCEDPTEGAGDNEEWIKLIK